MNSDLITETCFYLALALKTCGCFYPSVSMSRVHVACFANRGHFDGLHVDRTRCYSVMSVTVGTIASVSGSSRFLLVSASIYDL